MEPATTRPSKRTWRRTVNPIETRADASHSGNRTDQPPNVWVLRAMENGLYWSVLNNLSRVHYSDPVCKLSMHGHVMRDNQQRHR
jgi:hypothetical protein